MQTYGSIKYAACKYCIIILYDGYFVTFDFIQILDLIYYTYNDYFVTTECCTNITVYALYSILILYILNITIYEITFNATKISYKVSHKRRTQGIIHKNFAS